MAKLGPETSEIINRLRQEAFYIVDEATALEFKIFDRFGETELLLSYMDEMKNVAEETISLLSRLSTLQLQVARSQPTAAPVRLEMLEQAIQRTLIRIPALERSSQDGMEFSMTQQPRIPDSATSKRLLDNLRRSRLELAESNLELAEISALLEDDLRLQQLKRVRSSLQNNPERI